MDKRYTENSGLGMPLTILIIAVAFVLAGGVYYTLKQYSELPQERKTEKTGTPEADTDTDMGAMARSVSIPLNAQNKSGESGTAVLEDLGNGTKVTIRLTGAPAGVPQPAHIHVGSCPNPGAVKYPLPNVVNGEATVTLSMLLSDLMKELPLSINVHKSGTDLGTYVACGDIKDGDTMMKDDSMMKKDEGTMMKDDSMMKKDEGTMMESPSIQSFTITAKNFSFSQSEIRVKKGDTVKIALTVSDGMHNWIVDEFNARTSTIRAGETNSTEFVASKSGTFEYYCGVGSHRQMGMVGKLIVE